MAAMTRSELTIKDVSWDNLGVIPEGFRKLGIKLEGRGDDIYIPEQEYYEIQDYIDGAIVTIADAAWRGLTRDLLSSVLLMSKQARGEMVKDKTIFKRK